jgi:creatinine amidohydrolase
MRRLDRTTWVDVAAEPAPRPVLLVPLGACEQHGPHLPLGTDTFVATAVAQGAAALHRGALVAPALPYGSSGEHAGFPGTLSIGQAALEHVVVELVRSADWASGVVLVNGHGGNREPVERAVARLQDEGRAVRAWWPAAPEGGDLHAGHTETSMLLALAPEDVRRDRAERGATGTLAELWPAMREGGVRAVAANGVLGDPTGADADEGRRVLDAWISECAQAVVALRAG